MQVQFNPFTITIPCPYPLLGGQGELVVDVLLSGIGDVVDSTVKSVKSKNDTGELVVGVLVSGTVDDIVSTVMPVKMKKGCI